MSKIKYVKGRQVFDSRGNPTVEAEIILENGLIGRSIVPSGASTGRYEAHELRDKNKDYLNKSVFDAVNNINNKISKSLTNKNSTHQSDIDETLIHAEVSENVSALRTGMDNSNESKRGDKVAGIPVKIQALDGTLHDVIVRKRPGVDRFLRNLALEHDVYAFTASESYYAKPILHLLDPKKEIFIGCYYRTECTKFKGKTFVSPFRSERNGFCKCGSPSHFEGISRYCS